MDAVLADLSELLSQIDILLLDERVVFALKHAKRIVSINNILRFSLSWLANQVLECKVLIT